MSARKRAKLGKAKKSALPFGVRERQVAHEEGEWHERVLDLAGFWNHTHEDGMQRTAVHEAGHVLVDLVQGVDFSYVTVGRQHAFADGWVSAEGITPRAEGSTFEDRVAADLGGAVAEQVVFGDVHGGAEHDICAAFARCGAVDLSRDTDDLARASEAVRRHVDRVRRMLARRRRALEAVAKALVSKGKLTRAECARVARAAGSRVRVQATCSPLVPDDEWSRCERARKLVSKRRARLRRLLAKGGK